MSPALVAAIFPPKGKSLLIELTKREGEGEGAKGIERWKREVEEEGEEARS